MLADLGRLSGRLLGRRLRALFDEPCGLYVESIDSRRELLTRLFAVAVHALELEHTH